MTFMKGSAALDQASKDVAAAVQEFNSALAHFGHEVGFHTYEETKSISRDVKRIPTAFLIVNSRNSSRYQSTS